MKVLVLSSKSSSLDLLAEMAWRYSSQVARNREVVFLEIEKSRSLFSTEEITEVKCSPPTFFRKKPCGGLGFPRI
jgi:hypothetical protein